MEFLTLGIGTPSSIAHFVLVGLSPTGVVLGDVVTTANAFFRRTVTASTATFARTKTTAASNFRRSVTSADGER